MVKRILLSIVMLALIAYLIVAITAFNRKPADQTCRDMELVIKDTAYAGFITKDELKGILQQKGIYPIGKKMERISTKSLERELSKHPLIDQAECYKTPSGKVCVEVSNPPYILCYPNTSRALVPRFQSYSSNGTYARDIPHGQLS